MHSNDQPGGRVVSVLYCAAKNPAERKRGERYAHTCGVYLGTIHGAKLAETGQVLATDTHIDYHHGRVYYAPRCPECGMLTEFEILPLADGSVPEIPPPLEAQRPPSAAPGVRRRIRRPEDGPR